MGAKTDSTSSVEPPSSKISGVTESPAPNSGQKLSIFATKSGFVIPKNKLSGSLVPILRGAKKDGVGGATTESNSKQMQRKTKWGTDLTQDAAVRRGRALALQIRVDQITQQLKSGKLSTGNTQNSPLVDENSDTSCSNLQIDIKESESLQLEKREAIGEILKLDPSYKPPPGFKPLLKEASIPLPVKEYPRYNFIGLIYGPEGDNQKRLEKETGAKIQVQGTKADTGEKVETKLGNNVQCTYEDMHVLVSADTFEKVDAAVSIIELLLTSVTGNLAAASTPNISVSGDDVNALSQNPVGMPSNTILVATENQAIQPVAGATQMPGHQIQFSGPWFSTVPSHTPVFASSGNVAAHLNPSSLTRPFHFPQQAMNTPNGALSFGAQHAPVVGFNSIIPNRSVVSPQAQPPRQILHHSHMTQASPLGYIGPPRNPSIVSVQASSAETNASLPFPVPSIPKSVIGISPSSIPHRPLTSLGVSSGQGGAPVGGTISFAVGNMGLMAPPVTPPPRHVSLHPQPDMAFKPPSQSSNISMAPFPPHQAGIPPGPRQPVPGTTTNYSVQNLSASSSFPSPGLSASLPIPNSASGVTPYHTPVRPPIMTASGSGNFTFQPQQPNTNFQGVSRPNSQAATQGGIPQQLSGPRPPSLPFAVPERPVNQIFPRQQAPNQVDHTQARASSFPFRGNPSALSVPPIQHTAFPYAGQPAPRSPVPQMGVRNFMPAPQTPDLPSPQFPRAGSVHIRRNHPSHKFGNNHPMASGKPLYPADQIYDPFSPTSVQPPQHKSDLMK